MECESEALGRRVAGSVNLGVISIEVVVRTTSSLMPKMNIEWRRQWTENEILGTIRRKWRDGWKKTALEKMEKNGSEGGRCDVIEARGRDF